MKVYHGSNVSIDEIDQSKTYSLLVDENTLLYEKPPQEIYQMLLNELQK